MSLAAAMAADRAGDLVVAAAACERSLVEEGPTLPGLLDLAVLYWQATDFGLVAAKKLTADFVARASKRYPVLLAEARRRYPESTEAEFWVGYTAWTDGGADFSLDACRELLRRAPHGRVAAMYLFMQSKGREGEREALELLDQCRQDPTTRSRYVASVVESVLKRKRQPRN